MSVVSLAKTWLQYVPRPSISRDLAPACSCAVVIAAVPVPEQSGWTRDHRPDGVVELWFSKPSQNTAPEGQDPPCWLEDDELDGELDDEEEEELDDELDDELDVELVVLVGEPDDPSPLHSTSLNVKFTGGPLNPEYVP